MILISPSPGCWADRGRAHQSGPADNLCWCRKNGPVGSALLWEAPAGPARNKSNRPGNNSSGLRGPSAASLCPPEVLAVCVAWSCILLLIIHKSIYRTVCFIDIQNKLFYNGRTSGGSALRRKRPLGRAQSRKNPGPERLILSGPGQKGVLKRNYVSLS